MVEKEGKKFCSLKEIQDIIRTAGDSEIESKSLRIGSELEYQLSIARVNSLLANGGEETKECGLLKQLIFGFEEANFGARELSPMEKIKQLMKQNEISVEDVAKDLSGMKDLSKLRVISNKSLEDMLSNFWDREGAECPIKGKEKADELKGWGKWVEEGIADGI